MDNLKYYLAFYNNQVLISSSNKDFILDNAKIMNTVFDKNEIENLYVFKYNRIIIFYYIFIEGLKIMVVFEEYIGKYKGQFILNEIINNIKELFSFGLDKKNFKSNIKDLIVKNIDLYINTIPHKYIPKKEDELNLIELKDEKIELFNNGEEENSGNLLNKFLKKNKKTEKLKMIFKIIIFFLFILINTFFFKIYKYKN